MKLKEAELVERRRVRSASMDQNILVKAWVHIYDWREGDWYYFNVYVASIVVNPTFVACLAATVDLMSYAHCFSRHSSNAD